MKYTKNEFTTALQIEIIGSYTNTLVKTRKAQKGLRINHLQGIVLLYQFDVFGVKDMMKITGRARSTSLNNIIKMKICGYVEKLGRGQYRLTEEARTIAEVFTASFRPHVERIYKMMEEDIRRRL